MKWYYTEDHGETWNLVEGADGTTYTYTMDLNTWTYDWRAEVELVGTEAELAETEAEPVSAETELVEKNTEE